MIGPDPVRLEGLSTTFQQLNLGDELFLPPDRLVPFEHWAGHIPFAFWMVGALRPRLLVELGVHRGNSYCAFCQAIAEFEVAGRAFGVDTWGGDVHMAPEQGLLADLRAHHDPRYAAFSTLLEMPFDQARGRFADGSIDLLHIDGMHTYEAVRHDFETWLPALSERSVVLFHDIEVRRDRFGVWRFWDEVSQRFPAFAFSHSHGLGVLATGRDLPSPVAALFDNARRMPFADRVRRIFASQGRTLTLQLQNDALRRDIDGARAATQPVATADRPAPAQPDPLARQDNPEPSLSPPAGASSLSKSLPERCAASAHAAAPAMEASAEECAAAATIPAQAVQACAGLETHAPGDIPAAGTDLARTSEEHVPSDPLNGTTAYNLLTLDREEETDALRAEVRAAEARARQAEARARQAEASRAEAEERRAAAQAELDLIRNSTYWRAGWPLRGAAQRLPAGLRRILRRSLRVAWWSVTLQLRRRLREYRAARRQPVLPPDPPAHAPAEATPTTPQPIAVARPRTPPPAAPLPDLFPIRTAEPSGRIATLLHLRPGDDPRDFAPAIAAIPEAHDLIVSIPRGDDALSATVRDAFPHATILPFEPRGRDILPLVALASADVLFRYDLICKLRAPRDGGVPPGQLRDLVQAVTAAFAGDSDLGIVLGRRPCEIATADHGRDVHRRVAALGARIGLSRRHLWHESVAADLVWMRPFPLRMVAALQLEPSAFHPTADGEACPMADAVEWLLGGICRDAGMSLAETSEIPSRPVAAASVRPAPKLHFAAYYLPQFHPTASNDCWWGRGFTEWTNVTRARPQFAGHRQPRLPSELGFYDLRLAEAQEAQAALARWGGVSAFCYYHYWFDGRRELDLPLRNMLSSGRPDLPFFLCWANEPWSRNWDGLSRNVLIPQTYAPGWIEAFARDVAPALRDPRYFRLMGRPVLIIYRAMHIPGAAEALRRLRQALDEEGVADVHLSAVWLRFGDDPELPADPAALGLDSYSGFPPHQTHATDIVEQLKALTPGFTGAVRNYDSAVSMALEDLQTPVQGLRHRGVMAGWDNTARRGASALVFHGATPAKFRRWLRGIVQHELATPGPGERLVMINAWNEWAEGTYLEPDRDFGRGWLEAVRSARQAEP